MKSPLVQSLLLILLVGGLYALQHAVGTTTSTETTTALLASLKQEARSNWSHRQDPDNLIPLERALPWGVNIKPALHVRGALTDTRALQLTVPAVPLAICSDMLNTLMQQKAERLWLRVDVAEVELTKQPDLATRQQLCATHPDISVYFRF